MKSEEPVLVKSGRKPLHTLLPKGNLPAIAMVREVSLAEKAKVDMSILTDLE